MPSYHLTLITLLNVDPFKYDNHIYEYEHLISSQNMWLYNLHYNIVFFVYSWIIVLCFYLYHCFIHNVNYHFIDTLFTAHIYNHTLLLDSTSSVFLCISTVCQYRTISILYQHYVSVFMALSIYYCSSIMSTSISLLSILPYQIALSLLWHQWYYFYQSHSCTIDINDNIPTNTTL